MESAIIIAIITIVGQIVLFLLQKRLMNSQVRKNDMDASALLVERALNLSKQEVDTLSSLYSMLKEDYRNLCTEKNELEVRVYQRDNYISILTKTLRDNNISIPDSKEGG